MRKSFLCIVCLLITAALLCGCSGDRITVNGNAADVSSAGVRVEFPEEWVIFTGNDIYEITYSRAPDEYGSADELKKDLEDNGERYIVYAESPDENALALLSSQPLEGSADEELTVGSLARTVHDTTVFEYRVNGYYTESSLTEETRGGVSGWLSDIKIFEEQGAEVLSEQREFIFEKDMTAFSLKIFASGAVDELTQKISISAI